jgi:hypothetical protein
MSRVVLRARRGVEDANAVARLIIELGTYYSRLAPNHFAAVDEDGLAEWLAADAEWLDDPTNLGLVAETDGEVAGYPKLRFRSRLRTLGLTRTAT